MTVTRLCSLTVTIATVRESGSTLYVGLARVVPPTNTKFKPLLLPTQAGMPCTNTHKHRTSYFKSTRTFLAPAKRCKSITATRQKPEILAFLHHQHNNNNIYLLFYFNSDEISLRSVNKYL